MKIILLDLRQQFNSTTIEILSHVLFNLGDINGMAVICNHKRNHTRIKLKISSVGLFYKEIVKIRSKGKSKKLELHLDLGE